MSFTGNNLEQYLTTSKENHRNFFNSNRSVFSNNHILFKTPKFYEDAPAHLDKKTCLDVPFDIGHCANVAINHSHWVCMVDHQGGQSYMIGLTTTLLLEK